MTSQAATIMEHSEQFLPAFALINGVMRGQAGLRYTPLDVHLDELGPVPADGENVLGRWLALGSGMVTVTDAGMPTGVGGVWSGKPVPLFDGPCDIMLTERRLVILVLDGPTPVGRVGGRTGHVLIAVFPLEAIDYVELELKSGFRGTKEKGLIIGHVTRSMASLNLADIGMVWEGGRFVRFRGTKRLDILERLVAPIVAARRPNASGPDLVQLDKVLAGERISTPSEISAMFAVD